jgi:transcriptional regulator with GAF, ATPase, and Fis domain
MKTIIINSKKGESIESLGHKLKEIEKNEIIQALKECNFVRAKAARKLGITARMIGYKIKKYGLRTKEVGSVEDSGADHYGTQE